MNRLVVICLAVIPAVAAPGQPPPDYGYQWATIGAPGNPAFWGDDYGHFARRGSVSREYRMATTEVTNSDWIEFCRAYAPFYQGNPMIPPFTGSAIYGSVGPQGYEFTIYPGMERFPTALTWRLAARYCNWLTNGRINEPWAFERGAYDTSTFSQNPDGTFNDQRVHSSGALYWMPSADEWLKAAYFDPNHFGPGHGGWSDYPYTMTSPPVSGPPGVGQTNAAWYVAGELGPYSVGSYPAFQAPWGLLDVSGGMAEMTEDWWVLGTSINTDSISQPINEHIGSGIQMSNPFWFTYNGLRLASAVPAPGSSWIMVVFSLLTTRPRRKGTHNPTTGRAGPCTIS